VIQSWGELAISHFPPPSFLPSFDKLRTFGDKLRRLGSFALCSWNCRARGGFAPAERPGWRRAGEISRDHSEGDSQNSRNYPRRPVSPRRENVTSVPESPSGAVELSNLPPAGSNYSEGDSHNSVRPQSAHQRG
jgi:hypothetical protein